MNFSDGQNKGFHPISMLGISKLSASTTQCCGYKQCELHTVGPASKDVPESAIAEHPLPQNPDIDMLVP